ncbi:nucleotidyltransferase domain-containing protein [Bradyrhizobium embrapense]|uniref:nucleotidyltransferase domain-containing protein n=1 Tax=Bradyrhizobium embrapense TaxID=630921 RepID=UPI00067DC8AF|nr:nucleotidyltransferase [Bradyrhizobium embrapense]
MLAPNTAPILDDLLLDVVTIIELSDHDREVAENRYRRLKPHLERPISPLREALMNSVSMLYAQGSMAIGATIVSGTDEDRFDVDALVDMTTPADWSDDDALNHLFDALQGFPDVRKIVRCTRCVQMQFAFMHMDVTILDAAKLPRPERVGEIFHSPDTGTGYRVPSNPFGFSNWFRNEVTKPTYEFEKSLQSRRRLYGVDRLQQSPIKAELEQENLPDVIPPRLDSQQVLALKLMKRFLNLRYERRSIRKPPSIYLTKLAVTCGYEPAGLTAQLERLAAKVKVEMDAALAANSGPDERNPSYTPDRLNDRWPSVQADRKTLSDDMDYLINALRIARTAEMKDIAAIFDTLFGERVSRRTMETFAKRLDKSSGRETFRYERGSGTIIPVTASAAAAVASTAVAAPSHRFHVEE